MRALHTYWISLEKIAKPTPLNLGCGVTAYDRADALSIVEKAVARAGVAPKVVRVTEGVTLDDLEPRHVLPNIGDMSVRGLWFPQGF